MTFLTTSLRFIYLLPLEEKPLVQMATPSETSTKETTNYARVCRLLLDFGTPPLRDTFDRIHPQSKLSSVLVSNRTKLRKVTNAWQKEKLYPTDASASTTVPSSMDFDISLLTVLLRNICNSPLDVSREADIIRINSFRKKVFVHAVKASVDDTTFNTIWTDIQDAIMRLGGKKTEWMP